MSHIKRRISKPVKTQPFSFHSHPRPDAPKRPVVKPAALDRSSSVVIPNVDTSKGGIPLPSSSQFQKSSSSRLEVALGVSLETMLPLAAGAFAYARREYLQSTKLYQETVGKVLQIKMETNSYQDLFQDLKAQVELISKRLNSLVPFHKDQINHEISWLDYLLKDLQKWRPTLFTHSQPEEMTAYSRAVEKAVQELKQVKGEFQSVLTRLSQTEIALPSFHFEELEKKFVTELARLNELQLQKPRWLDLKLKDQQVQFDAIKRLREYFQKTGQSLDNTLQARLSFLEEFKNEVLRVNSVLDCEQKPVFERYKRILETLKQEVSQISRGVSHQFESKIDLGKDIRRLEDQIVEGTSGVRHLLQEEISLIFQNKIKTWRRGVDWSDYASFFKPSEASSKLTQLKNKVMTGVGEMISKVPSLVQNRPWISQILERGGNMVSGIRQASAQLSGTVAKLSTPIKVLGATTQVLGVLSTALDAHLTLRDHHASNAEKGLSVGAYVIEGGALIVLAAGATAAAAILSPIGLGVMSYKDKQTEDRIAPYLSSKIRDNMIDDLNGLSSSHSIDDDGIGKWMEDLLVDTEGQGILADPKAYFADPRLKPALENWVKKLLDEDWSPDYVGDDNAAYALYFAGRHSPDLLRAVVNGKWGHPVDQSDWVEFDRFLKKIHVKPEEFFSQTPEIARLMNQKIG